LPEKIFLLEKVKRQNYTEYIFNLLPFVILEKLGKRHEPEKEETQASNMKRLHFKKTARLYFSDLFKDQRRADLTCADFNKTTRLLVTGFASGMFALHQLPEFTVLQTLRYEKCVQNSESVNIYV
jgi:hypothetical protein